MKGTRLQRRRVAGGTQGSLRNITMVVFNAMMDRGSPVMMNKRSRASIKRTCHNTDTAADGGRSLPQKARCWSHRTACVEPVTSYTQGVAMPYEGNTGTPRKAAYKAMPW